MPRVHRLELIALEYHDVVRGDAFDESGFPGGAARSYKMSASMFESHCAAVAAAGVPIASDVRALPQSVTRVALFTFDDGGSSALDPTAGILERFGWRGHFFVTTGAMGTRGFLSPAQARELSDRGHVVGSHSHTHPVRMSHLSPAALTQEWSESIRRLEDALGRRVTVASVPGGYFGAHVARSAAEGGIEWLFTSEPESRMVSVDTCRVMGRYTLRIDSPATLARALVAPGGTARLKQSVLWKAKKAAKRLGGDTYLRLRASLLGDDKDAQRGALAP
ncbi:MAG: polysaccharide deacetylase family protein [Gemmatimonadaceae bacterium]